MYEYLAATWATSKGVYFTLTSASPSPLGGLCLFFYFWKEKKKIYLETVGKISLVFSISIVGNFIFFYFFPFCNGNHLSSWDDTFEISPPLFSWTTNTKHVGLLFVYTRNGTIFVCKHYFVRFYWKVNCKNGDRKLLLFSNSDGIYISWIIFLVKRRRDQWGASLWSDDKETRPSVSLWKEETFFKFLLFHIFIFTLRSLSSRN
jgi:hypothetical protein